MIIPFIGPLILFNYFLALYLRLSLQLFDLKHSKTWSFHKRCKLIKEQNNNYEVVISPVTETQ